MPAARGMVILSGILDPTLTGRSEPYNGISPRKKYVTTTKAAVCAWGRRHFLRIRVSDDILGFAGHKHLFGRRRLLYMRSPDQ